jgi:hypothetical protein
VGKESDGPSDPAPEGPAGDPQQERQPNGRPRFSVLGCDGNLGHAGPSIDGNWIEDGTIVDGSAEI